MLRRTGGDGLLNFEETVRAAQEARDKFNNDREIDGYPRPKHYRDMHATQEALLDWCVDYLERAKSFRANQ